MTKRETLSTGDYTHVLWDWDGCLAKTLHLWVKHYTETFKEEGIQKTREEIIASMGFFRRDIQTWGYSLDEANRMVKKTHDRATPELSVVDLYPGAKETIRTLGERGIYQAIVTKSQLHIVKSAAVHHGIYPHLTTIIGGDSVAEHQQKPHREPVDAALRLMGGSAIKAVIIGDSGTDLRPALNAEIDSILYYPEANKEFYPVPAKEGGHPTHTIYDLREVLDLVA